MKNQLVRVIELTLYHIFDSKRVEGPHSWLRGDCTRLVGDCSGLRGDCSWLRGDCSWLVGDCSGLRGGCTGLRGDLDECELTGEDRAGGVNVSVLVCGDREPIPNPQEGCKPC